MSVSDRELVRLKAVEAAAKSYLEVHAAQPFDVRKTRDARQKLADLTGFSPPPLPKRARRVTTIGADGRPERTHVEHWWQKD